MSDGASRRASDPYGYQDWAWGQIVRLGSELAATHGLVLLALAKHGNAEGISRPSARGLASNYLGRDERVVRDAFAALEEHGLIERVAGTPGAATRWRLLAPESADPGSALPSSERGSSADPGSAARGRSADQLRTNCGPTADPGSAEGEGEGEEQHLDPPDTTNAGEWASPGERTNGHREEGEEGDPFADWPELPPRARLLARELLALLAARGLTAQHHDLCDLADFAEDAERKGLTDAALLVGVTKDRRPEAMRRNFGAILLAARAEQQRRTTA